MTTIFLIAIFLAAVAAIVHTSNTRRYRREEYIERGMTLNEIKAHRDELARRYAFEKKAAIVGILIIVITFIVTNFGR